MGQYSINFLFEILKIYGNEIEMLQKACIDCHESSETKKTLSLIDQTGQNHVLNIYKFSIIERNLQLFSQNYFIMHLKTYFTPIKPSAINITLARLIWLIEIVSLRKMI